MKDFLNVYSSVSKASDVKTTHRNGNYVISHAGVKSSERLTARGNMHFIGNSYPVLEVYKNK